MGVTISKNKRPGGTLTPGPLTHQHEAHGLQGPIAKINHIKAMSATNNCNNDDSVTFNDITDLARHYGSTSLEDLGRAFYDETSFGVNTTFLAACHPTLKEIYYESGEHPATRPLPNIWAGHFCTGIRFGTIVEGSDAEFTATDLHFPISLAEIQESYDFLNNLYDEAAAS